MSIIVKALFGFAFDFGITKNERLSGAFQFGQKRLMLIPRNMIEISIFNEFIEVQMFVRLKTEKSFQSNKHLHFNLTSIVYRRLNRKRSL